MFRYTKYFFQRVVARLTDDKDMLRELSEERKAEKRERREELRTKQKERKAAQKEKKKRKGKKVKRNNI